VNDQPRPRLKIPARLLLIDALGLVLAALGLAGLFADLSGPLAFLADKNLAGIFAASGFALITFALGNIVRWHTRMRALQQTQTEQGRRT